MFVEDTYVDSGFIGQFSVMTEQEAERRICNLAEALSKDLRIPPEKMTVTIRGPRLLNRLRRKVWPANIPQPEKDAVTRPGIVLPLGY